MQVKSRTGAGAVERIEIKRFIDALRYSRAQRGVFITNSAISDVAAAYVEQSGVDIVVIDGAALEKLASGSGTWRILGPAVVRGEHAERINTGLTTELAVVGNLATSSQQLAFLSREDAERLADAIGRLAYASRRLADAARLLVSNPMAAVSPVAAADRHVRAGRAADAAASRLEDAANHLTETDDENVRIMVGMAHHLVHDQHGSTPTGWPIETVSNVLVNAQRLAIYAERLTAVVSNEAGRRVNPDDNETDRGSS